MILLIFITIFPVHNYYIFNNKHEECALFETQKHKWKDRETT